MLPHEHFGPGEQDTIISVQLINSERKILTIQSGEYEELNNRILQPGETMNVNCFIPKGCREYIKHLNVKGKAYIYVGYVSQEAVDPLIYHSKS